VTAGIDDGGDADFGPDFREPLTVLLDALDDEAELTLLGRWLTRITPRRLRIIWASWPRLCAHIWRRTAVRL